MTAEGLGEETPSLANQLTIVTQRRKHTILRHICT